MKAAVALVLVTCSLCNAVAIRPRAAAPQTFQLLPFEKAKSDAEAIGVFQPEPDHVVTHNNTAGKTTDGVDADVTAAGACDNPAVRPEWRDMSDDDKNAFILGIKCLLGKPSADPSRYPGSSSRYEDLVSVHQQMTGQIHMVAQFLPWHRMYISIFESFLRECGYGGPMPWWDEGKDAADFAASPLFNDLWFGPIPPKGPNGEETCLTAGFNIYIHIGPGGGLSTRCLARALDTSLTTQCTGDFVNYCNSYSDYPSMEQCAEQGPHAYCHNGVGGAMADVASSPGDPLFFMHHSFIDHAWRIWQNADPARLSEISGNTVSDGSGPQLDLDFVLTSMGLRDDITVRDVMDTQGGYLCYTYSY